MSQIALPSELGALLTEALAQHRRGNLADAERCYRQILTTDPHHFTAMHMMGVVALQVGNVAVAVQLLGEAARIRPSDAAVAANLTSALRQAGRLDEALNAAQKALLLKPDFSDARLNLVNVLADLNRPDEAADELEKAIPPGSSSVDFRLRLVNLRLAANQTEAAVDAVYDLLAISPLSTAAYTNLGVALRRLDRLDEAVATYRNALELEPDNSGLLNNLGIALQDLDQIEEAVDCFRRALAIQPGVASAWLNLSLAESALMHTDRAIASARRAVAADPSCPPAHTALSMALLMRGEYSEGFAHYEWRSKMPDFPSPKRSFSKPSWRGEDLRGRTIVVYDEQGVGDTIQFVRFAPLLSRMGARVFLECNSQIARLLKGLEGIEGVISRFGTLPNHDYQCSLLSLPHILGITLGSIPTRTSYIRAESELVELWSRRLEFSAGLKVGLIWAGNPEFKGDRLRSPGLEAFRPLFDIPGITFLGLQKGPGRAVLESADWLPPHFFDLDEQISDFADTAAIMANLDLIVTSCTGPAHLAGALGKPTWTIIPFSPDWRWLESGQDTPWYPTMRLFRQDAIGNWQTVMQRVESELSALTRV